MKKVISGVGVQMAPFKGGDVAQLPAFLGRCKSVGCTHVELTSRKLDLILGGRLDRRRAEAVAETVRDSGLSPVLHASHDVNFMDVAKAARHKVVAEATIELCGILGASHTVFHAGCVSTDDWRDDAPMLLQTERDAVRRLADRAAELDVRISLENMIVRPNLPVYHYSADPRALADQIARIDHSFVGMCLDTGHAWLSAPKLGFDFVRAVGEVSWAICHLHANDNCGIIGPFGVEKDNDKVAFGLDDLHQPIGWGTIPWAEILPRMSVREDTFLCVEINERYFDHLEEAVRTGLLVAEVLDGHRQLPATFPGAMA